MATIKCAVTTEGTFDFNDPSNWQFGTVPGAFDIAQFDQPVFNTVTGNATVAELLITQGSIDLTGSYTMSGAQPTELAIDGGLAELLIVPGASISGTGNISLTNGGALIIGGTVSGSSATNTDDVVTFGAPGQDGTVAFGSAAGIVNNPSTYTVVVSAGTLRPTDAELGIVLGADQHTTIQAAGTLDAAGFTLMVNDLQGGGHITDTGGAAGLTVNGGNFSGVIGGPLGLTLNGALTLSGNNTYTGGTTINGGSTLTLGAGGTAGSVAGAIADNGVLAINHSDNFVLNNVSGTGQLQQTGPGITWLGSGLSYTGGTRISAGTLIVNDPAALGSGGPPISGGQ